MLADNALTTVEKARKTLELASEDKDIYVIDAINMASAIIERYCNRQFKRDEYIDLIIESTDEVILSQFPVHRIISVNGKSVKPCLLDEEAGVLYQHISSRSKIVFEAGYTLPKDATIDSPRTLPLDIEGACLKLVRHLYEDDEQVAAIDMAGLKSVDMGDMKVQLAGASTESIPADVQQLLISYRKMNP